MLSPLGLAIQEDAAALRASFAQARPFAHVIVDGFLDP
jgi:hypothetical protein